MSRDALSFATTSRSCHTRTSACTITQADTIRLQYKAQLHYSTMIFLQNLLKNKYNKKQYKIVICQDVVDQ